MDYKKKLIISASILGVLVVLFIVGSIAAALRSAPEGEILYPAFRSDSIESITLADKTGRIEFRKSGEGWQIAYNGQFFPPDQSKIEGMLAAMADIRKGQVTSSNPASWSTFNVDDAQAVHLIMKKSDGATAVDCYFGKTATTSFTQYIRLSGSDDVIQATSRVDYSSNLKDWVQLKLFPSQITAENVSNIKIISKISFVDTDTGLAAQPRSISVTLNNTGEKQEDKLVWESPENTDFPISADKVSSLITTFAGFMGDSVVVDPSAVNLDASASPQGIVTLTLNDTTSYSLELFGAVETDPNKFYIKSGDGKYFYIASNWSLRGLFVGLENFIEATLLFSPQ